MSFNSATNAAIKADIANLKSPGRSRRNACTAVKTRRTTLRGLRGTKDESHELGPGLQKHPFWSPDHQDAVVHSYLDCRLDPGWRDDAPQVGLGHLHGLQPCRQEWMKKKMVGQHGFGAERLWEQRVTWWKNETGRKGHRRNAHTHTNAPGAGCMPHKDTDAIKARTKRWTHKMLGYYACCCWAFIGHTHV